MTEDRASAAPNARRADAAPGRAPLARNTLLNLAGYSIPLLVAVVAIPIVVRGLGPARFGILSLVWVVVGYASIFDLGLGRAATRRVAEALGRGEAGVIPGVAWTAIVVQAITGVAGGLALVAAAPTITGRLLKIPPGLVPEATASFYVLAFDIPAILVLSSLRGVLEASQRFDLVNAVRVPLATSNFALPLLGVVLHWDLPPIVGLLVCSTLLGAFAYYRGCVRVFPGLREEVRFHRREFRELLAFGSWVTVSSIMGPVLVYADRVMLGALVSVTAVGLYAAPYEMITRASVIPGSLVATLFPAVATLGARGQLGELESLVSRSVKFLLLTVGPVAMVSVALAPVILRLWVGPRFSAESAAALGILAVGVLANSLAQVPYSMIQALKRADVTAKIHLGELPVHLGLVWLLVKRYGVTGAALAWSLRVAVDAAVLFFLAGRLFRVPLRCVVTGRVATGFLILGSGTLCLCAARVVAGGSWVGVLAGVAVLGAVVFAAWSLALNQTERLQMKSLLRMAAAPRP